MGPPLVLCNIHTCMGVLVKAAFSVSFGLSSTHKAPARAKIFENSISVLTCGSRSIKGVHLYLLFWHQTVCCFVVSWLLFKARVRALLANVLLIRDTVWSTPQRINLAVYFLRVSWEDSKPLAKRKILKCINSLSHLFNCTPLEK